jgi:hypothetical protein
MFGSRSPQPPFFSANSAPSSLKSPLKLTTQLCTSLTAQLLPSFSTPSKHRAHTTTHDSFPLYALLRVPPDTPSEVPLPTQAPLNPLETILTKSPVNVDSKQLTKTLNPLNATLTEIAGGPTSARSRYSLFTTHYSLPLSFRYTISRHTP